MRCDIIIPVWNQPVFTKDCVDSIAKNTHGDYRLIIIDNGSDDRTRIYLEGLKARTHCPVLLMRNEKNVGFIKAVNQGIKASVEPYVCIVNNDTLVTRGWLSEMVGVISSAPDIGVVNPSSNTLGQKPVRGEPIELYAVSLKKLSGTYVELGSAIGFCMLIKREVIERIGLFDEIYGMGNFEDTDFSRRAVKEGYRCVRACGAYVWHRESSSFNKIKTFDEDFKRNREIYESRWGIPKRIAYVMGSDDGDISEKLRDESMRLARGGNWVWYFTPNAIDVPAHSNIRSVCLPERLFLLNAIFHIMKKKKKFNEIIVGNERFGNLLNSLGFIHKAKVSYY